MAEVAIVLIGDDDWEALNRLTAVLSDRYYLLLARTGGKVVRMARKFKPDVILLTESLRYAPRGLETLLPELVGQRGFKVIVLTEDGPEPGRDWQAMGAVDALAHPTKYSRRARRLEKRILELLEPKLGRIEL